MKKITFTLVVVILATNLSAQLLSKSTSEKRNALIELNTGRRASYDPSAHKIVDDIIAQNPRVVALNLHCGPFANRTPNYRSKIGTGDYGDSVYQHPDVKLFGWPAGSINRRNHGNGQKGGTSISRDKFDSTVAVILNENSPVNVSV